MHFLFSNFSKNLKILLAHAISFQNIDANSTPSNSWQCKDFYSHAVTPEKWMKCKKIPFCLKLDEKENKRTNIYCPFQGGDGGPEGERKLENPYYYYGSTRNQKSKGAHQKPRPLLPSQRQAMELQARVGGGGSEAAQPQPQRPKSRQETSRPSSRQALLHHQESLQVRSREAARGGTILQSILKRG